MPLTCGEECQVAAKLFSSFTQIPNYFANALGIAIVNGCTGVAVIRLKSNGNQSNNCLMHELNSTFSYIHS